MIFIIVDNLDVLIKLPCYICREKFDSSLRRRASCDVELPVAESADYATSEGETGPGRVPRLDGCRSYEYVADSLIDTC